MGSALLAFIGLGLGLLASLFAIVVMLRRQAVPASVRDDRPGDAVQPLLDQVSSEAEQILSRAQADAAQVVERAVASVEQAEKTRNEVEDEVRTI